MIAGHFWNGMNRSSSDMHTVIQRAEVLIPCGTVSLLHSILEYCVAKATLQQSNMGASYR